MAISDNLRSVPKIFFPVFVTLVLGMLFLTLGLSTPHWTKYENHNNGLWIDCRSRSAHTVCSSIIEFTFVGYIFRGLSTTAVLLSGTCGLAALAFVRMENRRRTLAFLIAIGALISFVASVIVNMWFGLGFAAVNQGTAQLGWSYVLSCLGSSLVLVTCVLGFVMASNIRPTPALPGAVIHNPQAQPQTQTVP